MNEYHCPFQDKLHQNICRKRTLVAIGTHDLDTISGGSSIVYLIKAVWLWLRWESCVK